MLASLLSVLSAAASLASADSVIYPVINHGRPAGEMIVITRGDTVLVKYQHTDRNRGVRTATGYRFGTGGMALAGWTGPLAADGNFGAIANRFEIVGDSVRRWSGASPSPLVLKSDKGTWIGFRSTAYDHALLARFLLKQPNHTTRALTGGTLRLEIGGDTTVRIAGKPVHARFAMVYNATNASPLGVWIDDAGALIAGEVGWFIAVRPGGEGALPTLRKIETRIRDAQGEAIGKRLGSRNAAGVVIRNADLFDSESGTVKPNMTVVIKGDRIVSVEPAESAVTPPGATVIDATGKTIVPGLWDMHGHAQMTSQGGAAVAELAQGITTVRDLAADIDVAVSLRDRSNAGKLATPRLILGGFIEGPGKWAGPSEVLVRTEAEARSWVARYDSLGYKQIKLYNIVHPDLVPTIAEEAHKRGMILSGHIPRGLSVQAAVRLGFDEIQHAAFLFSTFYQDSLYYPTMRAYSAVATAVAPNIDVDSAPMTELIGFLRERGTVIDGTFNLWIRGGAGANLPNVTGVELQDVAKADKAYLRLIKRLYDGGVTLVAGTDNSQGTTYFLELERYEEAGIPTAKVLQIATIVAAKFMKDDANYGSIAPGKIADLVIVDGKPAEKISELRKRETVIRAGRVYSVKELLAAAGLGGQ